MGPWVAPACVAKPWRLAWPAPPAPSGIPGEDACRLDGNPAQGRAFCWPNAATCLLASVLQLRH